jgi:hypothetical protein
LPKSMSQWVSPTVRPAAICYFSYKHMAALTQVLVQAA